MSKANEIIKQLIDNDEVDMLSSKEDLEKVLSDSGCTKDDIDEVMTSFKGFPLDDEDLMAIAGGSSNSAPGFKRTLDLPV